MFRARPLAIFALLTLPLAACRDQLLTNPAAPQAVAATSPDLAGRYIVVFRPSVPDVDALVEALTRAHGGIPGYRYHTALKGYAATLPAAALDGIRRNPNVAYVEPDGIATIVGSGSESLSSAQWGLDRIDQHPLTRDNLYTWQADGTGVEAYIVDTGIRFSHQEFGGRASSFYDYVDNDTDASDCDGHGTHVAGTVGGSTAGVAKNVTLKAARVLDCNGSGWFSDIVAAIDDITTRKVDNPAIPMVGNMSLGGGFYAPINTAVNNSVAAGVVWAVAAGNNDKDACRFSPAAAADALTVGATTSSDARSSFSNFGTCLDLFAPGSAIYSSTMTADNTYESWSGTSMATPHVTGVAAIYLSAWPDATAYEVNQAVTSRATSGVVTGGGTGSPNLLLYSLLTTPRYGTAPTYYLLTVTPGGTGSGTVTSSPAGIDCGSTCSASFTGGTSVTLTAAPAAGSAFAGWGGACSGTGTCSVAMDQAKSVTAAFNLVTLLHLGGLTAVPTRVNKNWAATATATVHDAGHALVSGAVVTFALSGGTSGTGSCTTGATGQCTYTKSGLKNNVPSVTFTVTGISKTGTSYNPSANDTGTATTVTK